MLNLRFQLRCVVLLNVMVVIESCMSELIFDLAQCVLISIVRIAPERCVMVGQVVCEVRACLDQGRFAPVSLMIVMEVVV